MKRLTLALILGLLVSGAARAQSNPCSSSNNHCVVLSWTASSTSGVGYDVFRGTTPGQEGTSPLNSTPVAVNCSGAACTWTDNNVSAGQTYYYVLTAVAGGVTGGVQSAKSNEASAGIPVFPPTNVVVATN